MNKESKTFKYSGLKLAEQANLAHGFFTRKGGVSKDLHFQSLNCNLASSDSKKNVITNREIISNSLGFSHNKLITVTQIHSNRVISIKDGDEHIKHPVADALVTNLPGILLGIKTADCAPILFFDPKKQIIAAAHAGWKGAISGIIGNTIAAMQNLGANIADIICVIGPCIQQASYEVDESFYNNFISVKPASSKFFINSKQADHYMFDLPAYCVERLKIIGIQHIDNLGIDTYSNPEFFSYRRATHEKNFNKDGKAEYGTQLSVVGIL
ncbi:Laccase domain protein [Candidatus Jidaibacter acanthamoeba]|uniref:Purine nucleoside phosphorylase n=1 Tax=Candidatus Jidaibacter acanthamoebae TaxID=86105 RepID=A0A0C1MV94_9RICK|nr:peptidoglycan editing factor PgeF [Candidatus Jidaibacter acanthamoeba]KIE06092.1 Laccase domain protein [Candidatus Jidaibacter acanthamoeba]